MFHLPFLPPPVIVKQKCWAYFILFMDIIDRSHNSYVTVQYGLCVSNLSNYIDFSWWISATAHELRLVGKSWSEFSKSESHTNSEPFKPDDSN